jgi:hypothetical protein
MIRPILNRFELHIPFIHFAVKHSVLLFPSNSGERIE